VGQKSSVALPPNRGVACRPVLRWAGSKLKLLPTLETYWRPHHKTYIEPFAGSACLYFHLSPTAAVLGDNNVELIDLYRTLRLRSERLFRRLSRIPNAPKDYYRWRALNPLHLDSESRALRFLYLNRHCFNGIYRTNSRGDFNVPMGTRLPTNFTLDTMNACARRLKNARLVAGDFAETLKFARQGDFVYMDPPFASSLKRIRGEYGAGAFSGADIERLDEAMTVLNKTHIEFVVSYGDCRESRWLARRWHARRVRVRRHVAGFSGHRRAAFEWLMSNFS
jgi:DNA adenine methylase